MESYVSPHKFADVIPPHCVSGLHLNVRSLRKHHDDGMALLTQLNRMLQFIGLTETWLLPNEIHLYSLNGYNTEASCRSDDNHTIHAGGASLFVSEEISYSKRTDLCLNIPKCESVWIEIPKGPSITLPSNVIVGVIYRSPSSSYNQFCRALDELLCKITNERKNVVLMGDININLADIDSVICEEYINCFTTYGLSCLLKKPTRVASDGSSSLIDHILTNLDDVTSGGVILADISDHYPVYFCLQTTRRQLSQKSVSKTVFDRQRFVDLLSGQDWNSVYSHSCPNTAYNNFVSIVGNAILKCSRVISSSQKYLVPRNPWITYALLMSIKKKKTNCLKR